MTTLDRYMFRGLTVNYVIALGAMMSLYVVLDLFFNMDEFTENESGVLLDIFSFYGNRVFLYFSQLSGVITLFACLVTLARMRRQNELTAVLSSGVSLYRVAAPVIAFGVLTSALWYVDTEVVIPRIAHKLARRHDDARGLRTYRVRFLRDRDNALLSALQYLPSEQVIKQLAVMKRSPDGVLQGVLLADLAHWVPDPSLPVGGRWHLERGREIRQVETSPESIAPREQVEQVLVDVYDSDLDPKAIEMRQASGWTKFLSTGQLTELSKELEGEPLRQARKHKHARFTTPIVNLIMLLLGLPFILDRMPGSLLVAGGKALAVCGFCFLVTFVAQNFTVTGSLSTLPAWSPVILFTPVCVVLLDRLRT